MGGSNSGKQLADVDQYDPATDTWTPKTPLTNPHAGLSLGSTPDGKLLAIGGIGSGGLVALATVPGPLLPAPTAISQPALATAVAGDSLPLLPAGIGGVFLLGAVGIGAIAITRRKPAAEISGESSPSLSAFRPWGVNVSAAA